MPDLLAEGFIGGLRYEPGEPVGCSLDFQDDTATQPLDTILEQGLEIEFTGRRRCTHCQEPVRKLYGGGYCYPCFTTLARCDLCVMSPDRCHYDQGTCREPDWGRSFCMQKHTVYLANSSGTKVGITRAGREARRWMDQGAIQALPVAETDTRRAAGQLEVLLARHIPDRTDWRRLVSVASERVDLAAARDGLFEVLDAVPEGVRLTDQGAEAAFEYPVSAYVQPRQCKLARAGQVAGGMLLGVKGQYLMLDSGVFNVAHHRGCEVRLMSTDAPRRPDAPPQLELF